MTWPEELGGRGLTHVDAALVEDVFGYHWLPLSLVPPLRTRRSAPRSSASPRPSCKERLLPGRSPRGELMFCQGFSEPRAGSDLASLDDASRARGDRFVVDGHKIWTSSAWLADWIYLAVRTNPAEPRHRGISVLVAPLDTPGIEVRRFPVLGGGYLCEVFLDGVEIPAREPRRRARPRLGRAHAHARLRAGHGGEARWPRAGCSTGSSAAARDGRLDARLAAVARRCAASSLAARLLSLRAADLLDRGRARERRVRDGQARGARLAQRLAREGSSCSGSRASRTAARGAARGARRRRSTARRSARRSPAAPPRSCRSSSRGAGLGPR